MKKTLDPTDPESRERLPVWAQKYITQLEGSVEYWKREAYSATTEDESDTYLHTSLDRDLALRGLPARSTIQFGNRKQHGHRIDVRFTGEGGSHYQDGWVEVMLMSESHLLIIPKAANMILVRDVYAGTLKEGQ